MFRKTLGATALALAFVTTPLFAGPFAEFESQLRGAYSAYRAALFQTNMGDAEKTGKAMKGFEMKWAALRQNWANPVPPQYADDAGFMATLDKVAAIHAEAGKHVAAGELGEAHEVLEEIREELGALHLRNGLYTFSDRMNAYHAKMEEVLLTDYAAMGDKALGDLRAKAAVLAYLATDIAANPAPEQGDPAYAPLVQALQASVTSLEDAVAASDLPAALKAAKSLKKPFAKLFVKFG